MTEREPCIDTGVGCLIAAYELGLLVAEDAASFELHLADCSACLESLYAGAPTADALLREPERYSARLAAATADRPAAGASGSPHHLRPISGRGPSGKLFRLALPQAAAILASAAALLLIHLGSDPDLASLARIEPLPFRVIEYRSGGDASAVLRERGFSAYSAGDYGEAAALLGRSLAEGDAAREPEAGAALGDRTRLYLGLSLLLAGRPEQAHAPLLVASASPLRPVSESARWYLAQCSLQLDRPDDAETHMRFLADHGIARADAAREQLARLRDFRGSRRAR